MKKNRLMLGFGLAYVVELRLNFERRRRGRRPTSCQYIGVYQYKDRPGKWYVKVQCRGEVTTLGPFDSEIEAARARDREARERLGEYAGLNLPEDYPAPGPRP